MAKKTLSREANKLRNQERSPAAVRPAAPPAKPAKPATAAAKVIEAVKEVVVPVVEAVKEHVVEPVVEAVKEHVVEPVAEAVGVKKKARFVREKTEKRPRAAAPAPLARSTKLAGKLMSKNVALPPKDEPLFGSKVGPKR